MSDAHRTDEGAWLDLDRQRTVAQLLATTLSVFRQQWRTVLSCTGCIVLVVGVIEGIGLGQITGHYQTTVKESTELIQLAIAFFVVLPLVNATIALLLGELAAGRRVLARELVPRALDVFAPTLLATLMYGAVVYGAIALLGLALVIPSLYFLVVWFFTTQSVAIDGKRAGGALRRSAELVYGNWWRVLRNVVVMSVVFGLVPVLALGAPLDYAARSANAEVIEFVGDLLVQVVSLSLVALFTGLLFFQLRAARAAAAPLQRRQR